MNPRRRSRYERPRHGRRGLAAYRRSIAQPRPQPKDDRQNPKHYWLSLRRPETGWRHPTYGWQNSARWWRRVGRPVERLRKDFEGDPPRPAQAEAPNALRRARLRVTQALVPGIKFSELPLDLRRQANQDEVEKLRADFE